MLPLGKSSTFVAGLLSPTLMTLLPNWVSRTHCKEGSFDPPVPAFPKPFNAITTASAPVPEMVNCAYLGPLDVGVNITLKDPEDWVSILEGRPVKEN